MSSIWLSVWLLTSSALGQLTEEGLSKAEEASNRGAGYAAEGDFRRAASAFRKAVGLDPAFTVAHYNLGLALLRLEDYDDAVHAFTSAVRLEPTYADAWFHMGLARMAQDDYEDAEVAFENALQYRPGNPAMRYRLGQTLWQLGRWGEAVDVWEALMFDSPGHATIGRVQEELPRAYYNLGRARQLGEDAEGAERAYREALRLVPDDLPTLTNFGLLLRSQGDHDEAIELFERGLEYESTPSLTMALALSCAATEQFARSDSLLISLIDQGELLHDANVALAQNRVATGDIALAVEYAKKAADLRPKNVRTLFVLAFVLEHNAGGIRYGSGYEESSVLAVYDRAVLVDPDNPRLFYNIGVVHAKARRWDTARAAFEKAIDLDSDYTEARDGLRQIDQITGIQLIPAR